MKTEEEARLLGCPFTRNFCTANDGAMWVWHKGASRNVVVDKNPTSDDDVLPNRPENVPVSWRLGTTPHDEADGWVRWVEPESDWLARRQGRCGLIR